jgi:predicted ArsR family transcriptional regulator
VDRAPLTAEDFSAAVTAITSAFGDPTRREIYLFVRDRQSGATASEVAERFDLHPNVARHHLDKLTAGAYLDVGVERGERGGAGRPSKRYRATGREMALELPIRRDDLMMSLLGKALTLLSAEQAEQMAEEVGKQYGRVMAAAMPGTDGPRSFRDALHAVAGALTAHGFAAHTEKQKQGNGLFIVAEHCPFGGTAVEHPVLCAVDRGMVKGMLAELYGETQPEVAASRPKGDDVCVTTF